MAANVKSDAVPFPEAKTEFSTPTTGDKEEKEKRRSRKLSSSSSSSDSDFDLPKKDRNATIISINKAQDVHIGHKFLYSNTLNYTNQHCTESDYGSSSHSACNTNNKGPVPSPELINSTREIETEDMYTVSENISRYWKKLARFLPPKGSFSDGQIKTFEDNNPGNQEEAIYQMLVTWKQRHPERATIGVLAETLWDIGKGDIAQKLKS